MKVPRVRSFKSLTVFGLVMLACANTASILVQRHTSLPERLTDPVYGFLYGVGIGATLLGIWRQRRAPGGHRGCA